MKPIAGQAADASQELSVSTLWIDGLKLQMFTFELARLFAFSIHAVDRWVETLTASAARKVVAELSVSTLWIDGLKPPVFRASRAAAEDLSVSTLWIDGLKLARKLGRLAHYRTFSIHAVDRWVETCKYTT